MKIVITKSYDEMSEKAFEVMKQVVLQKNDAVIGLATGTTPLGLYNLLIKACENKEISFKDIKTINLDEYKGIDKSNKNSYHYFMQQNLFKYVDINQKNIYIEKGNAECDLAECKRYNELLDKFPQDIQLLGIGSDGHIGFNEPGTKFDSLTHVVNLKKSTIKDNSRLFNKISEVPKQAYTQGIKNIMNAKKILIIANGKNKAKAVQKAICGPITEKVPASILQLHPDCTFILDEEAASLL